MTETTSGKTALLTHLKGFGFRLAIVLLLLIVGDALYFSFVWGRRGEPAFHPWAVLTAAFVCAVLVYGFELLVARFPDVGWLARLHIPRWTALEPFFKGTRIPLTIVFLSYVLFYVTEGVAKDSRWAIWVNEHVFNFDVFCRHFSAIDTIRIEIAGYVLYVALHGIYNYYCPPILAHSIRKSGGLAREDAALVFALSVEKHGRTIPPSDLAKTICAFAAENRESFDEDTKVLLDERLRQLEAATRPRERSEAEPAQDGARIEAAPPATAAAVAADAADVARLFPSKLAIETYYLGVALFDILYPTVRGVLCAGLVAAILATSLPVAAKLLWVAFPRLGEACMTDLTQVPTDFRDSEWVEFEGKVDTPGPDDTIIIPADDANERWTLESKNVTVIKDEKGSRIFLRIGGVVKEVKTLGASSGGPPFSPAPDARMSKQCNPAGSRCSNHIEICCGTDVSIGKCYGRWPCPRQP
jgi:hypothetical protein